MRSNSLSHARSLRTAFLAIAVGSIASVTFGQYGVSPSQTGMFFDDLRGRAGDRSKTDQVRQGEGVYDYSEETGYESGQSTDGAGASVLREASRQIAQGYNSVGNLVYSQRQAGDYSQFSGPYPSSSTFFAPPYTSDPFLGGRRNLKLGPVNVGFGMTGLVEYNDNITRSGTDPVSDVIASAYLNISANYQLTQKSALSLSTAIGFDHYFDHPELSPYGNDLVLNVLPGSTISIDGTIGPVYVIVYDRMSVRPATQNDFAMSDRNIFGVFQNDAGIGTSWAINSKTNLSVNYTHSTANTLESELQGVDVSRYDRTIDSIQGSLAWSPTGVWTTGIEGGTSWVAYDQNYNNDGVMSNVGAFFTTPLGKSTSLRVSAGVQDFSFDAPEIVADDPLTADVDESLSTSRDANDLSDFYYNVTLSNRLSSRVSHALNFGREAALNTVSNYISADYVSYGVGIIAWSGSRLMLSGYYENAQDSGGIEAEDIEQWGFDAYLSHQLSPRMRLGLGYHYGNSESNGYSGIGGAGRNYIQHAFNFDISYAFSRKLVLTAGYRFLTTDAEDDTLDFDQNRVVFSANYNF